MLFKMKYTIEKNYITTNTKRRSGLKMPRVSFIVAHDTGNAGSTADQNVRYYENSKNEMSASAHTFIDDKQIIECIPATTGIPEKAWHVLYNVTTDNELYKADANDEAIGVELCYGERWKDGVLKYKINDVEAYKRYVWYIAYLCHKFNLDPTKKITGHYILDPKRKTDPVNAFSKFGKTWDQFNEDVVNEYRDCTKAEQLQNDNKGKSTVDENTKNEAIKSIEELVKAGVSIDLEFWKNHLNEPMPAWAYFIIAARAVKVGMK